MALAADELAALATIPIGAPQLPDLPASPLDLLADRTLIGGLKRRCGS
jgi:hypothetical protein